MQVRLTPTREASIWRALHADKAMVDVLEHERWVAGARIDVCAPYAAWLAAYEALVDYTFNNRGVRRHGVTTATQAALKDLGQALGFYDRHPALRGAGVVGHHALLIPAWRLPEPDRLERLYTTYPFPGQEFVVLRPSWRTGPGRAKVTEWEASVPASSPRLRLAEEATHQLCFRDPLFRLRNVDVDR